MIQFFNNYTILNCSLTHTHTVANTRFKCDTNTSNSRLPNYSEENNKQQQSIQSNRNEKNTRVCYSNDAL